MKTPLKKPKSIQDLPDNLINWFEIPAANFERAVKFYSEIFEIDLETNIMNGYSMAFFPGKNGAVGAIICGEGSIPHEQGPLLYFNGGNDLDEILGRVESAGGKVLMEKQMINDNAGYFALFIDSEGNRLALHSKH